MRRIVAVSALSSLALAGAAVAHPHFNKTVTAKLPAGVEATVTYNTTPANEIHATNAAVGTFVTPRRPMLKLSGEVKAGAVTIPAGEYTIGVIKKAEKDWTMALYPGAVARGQTPEVAKAIRLESLFSGTHGAAEHMLIDITPGHGALEGRAVLTMHFGNLFLSGALS
ncbi:MAG TPA: hypothetical protein VMR21_01670 [Vicinamibacteria bacterium]|nr:hypothetical protein [Vicinamibacteria bacterium]